MKRSDIERQNREYNDAKRPETALLRMAMRQYKAMGYAAMMAADKAILHAHNMVR